MKNLSAVFFAIFARINSSLSELKAEPEAHDVS